MEKEKTTRIVVTVTEKTHEQLRAAAAQQGLSMTAFVNVAIQKALRSAKRNSPDK